MASNDCTVHSMNAQCTVYVPMCAGVHVKLTKRRAYDFLEKLVYVVLPSQNAFEGLLLKSLDKGGNIHFRWEVGVLEVCQ